MKKYLVEMWDGNKYVVQIPFGWASENFTWHNFRLTQYAHFVFDVIECKAIKARFPTDDYVALGEKFISFKNSPIVSVTDLKIVYRHLLGNA